MKITLITFFSLFVLQSSFADDRLEKCKTEIYSEAIKALTLILNQNVVENKVFKLEKIEIDPELENGYAVTIKYWDVGEVPPANTRPFLQARMIDSISCKVKEVHFYH